MINEDDEDVLIFKDDKRESDLLVYVKFVIKNFVANELRIPSLDE